MGKSILEDNCFDECNERKNTVKCFFKDFFHCVIPLLFLYGFWLLWLLCLLKFSEYNFNFALDIWQVKVYRWFSGLFVFLFCCYCGLGKYDNDGCLVFLFRLLGLVLSSIYIGYFTGFNFSNLYGSGPKVEGLRNTIYVCNWMFFCFVQVGSLKYFYYYFSKKERK